MCMIIIAFHVIGWLTCLLQGNSTLADSGWPSSLISTLSRNQPQPPPRPSWPIRTLLRVPSDTASITNSSAWGKQSERKKRDVKGWNAFLSNIRNCIWYAFGILCVVAALMTSILTKEERDKRQGSQMCGHKIVCPFWLSPSYVGKI